MTPEQGGKLGEHGTHIAEAGAVNVSVNGPTSGCTGGAAKESRLQKHGFGGLPTGSEQEMPRKS